MNFPRFIRRLFSEPYDGFKHFATVTEGKLYRCGQPRPEQLEELINRYKIKTVVSFRGSRNPDDPDAWEQVERETCEKFGASFHTLPCNHKNPPTREQVAQFLDWCRDEAKQPLLVHCRIGQQRTMMFVSLFRVHIEGIDPEAAEKEMDELGFRAHVRRHRRLLDKFREYARMDFSPTQA